MSTERRLGPPFTDEDDQHLFKYLATCSPGTVGRCGNKLYRDLVDNVDGKWSWSERHTWQSWRARYVKDQDWFNHRIRRYQKKKNLPQDDHTVPRSSKSKISTPFTDEENQHLVKYLATYTPGTVGRCGNKLYKDLVDNVDKKWPWSEQHTWQSWRDRYSKNQDWFNHRIQLYQKKKNLPQEHHTVPRSSKPKIRSPFTDEDDQHLVKYLATCSPGVAGRCGFNLYKSLVKNVDEKWPWSEEHSWQSWRERYRKNQDRFNQLIRMYQEKENLPDEHRTVPLSFKPKTGPTTAAEEEADDDEEVRQRKRKRVSKAGNRSAKRPKHDQAPSVTRPAQKRANPQAGAVVGPSKRRPSALASGQKPSFKTGTVDQGAKRPPNFGHSPAENTDTEEEDEAGPVHSDDYGNEIFADKEPDDGEFEVDAMMTDDKDEEIHDIPEPPNSPHEDHELVYSDLKTSPPPSLPTREFDLPGRYDSAHSRPASPAKSPRRSKRRPFLIHPSQGPTPPVSGTDNSTLSIHSRVSAKKRAVRPLLLKDPLITNPTNKNQSKSSRLRRRNIDDDPFETPPPTPQPAAKPKRPPILVQGDFRTAFNSRPTDAGSDSDSPVEIVETKTTWSPQQNKGVTTRSKTLVKLKNDAGPMQKVDTGKDKDQNTEAAPLTNQHKDTETVVDPLAKGGVDENHAMDVDDEQADGAALLNKGVEGKPCLSPIQLAVNGQLDNCNGKARAEIESEEGPSNVTKVNDMVNAEQGQTSLIPNSPPRRWQPVQVNAVATSSKVTFADLPTFSLNSPPQLPYEYGSLNVEPRSPRTSTPLNTSRRKSRRSVAIAGSLSSEELEVVFEFGVRGVLEKMATDLGFAYKPVRLIFEQTKSFNKTLVVLHRIMEAGNKVGNETLAELALEDDEEEDDDDDEANQSHILGDHFFDTPHKAKAKRASLNDNPFLDDDQVSENSPRTKSRAEFSRLVKQGREDEALSRERQRSGHLPRHSSPPTQPPTPSPPPALHPKAEPGNLPSNTRKLSDEEMYDLFGGPLSQSTVEDSQSRFQPELHVQELKAEFKRLAMTVTAHDTSALEFEKNLDPAVLRAWTMELILERTAPPLKSSPQKLAFP